MIVKIPNLKRFLTFSQSLAIDKDEICDDDKPTVSFSRPFHGWLGQGGVIIWKIPLRLLSGA